MAKLTLKPCPFCGGEAKATHHSLKPVYMGMRTFAGYSHLEGRTLWTIKCLNQDCPVKPFTSLDDDKTRAAERWNTRSASE